jgi:hypothetical protein
VPPGYKRRASHPPHYSPLISSFSTLPRLTLTSTLLIYSSLKLQLYSIIINTPPPYYGVATRSARAPEALIRPCYLCYSKNFTQYLNLTCVKQGNRSVCEHYRRLNKPCHPIGSMSISNYPSLTGLGSLVLRSPVKSVNPLSKRRVSAS